MKRPPLYTWIERTITQRDQSTPKRYFVWSKTTNKTLSIFSIQEPFFCDFPLSISDITIEIQAWEKGRVENEFWVSSSGLKIYATPVYNYRYAVIARGQDQDWRKGRHNPGLDLSIQWPITFT